MTNREIIAEGLVKRYAGNVLAVDNVSFQVEAGEIFGFLARAASRRAYARMSCWIWSNSRM